MLRRRIWLAGIAAVVFVLQGPLCALACLDDPEAAPGVAHHQEPSCHDAAPDSGPGSVPVSAPLDAPSSPEGCGCELVTAVALPNLDISFGVPALAFVPPSNFSPSLDRVVQWARSAPKRADLPPPDILLLKSTLLI